MNTHLLALAVLALSGCAAATHTVALEDGDQLAWANSLFATRPTVVVLEDGSAYDALALRLEADTTTWVDPQTQALVAVPTASVLEVERRDPRRASLRIAGRGALVGAAVGAVGGAALGYSLAECFIFCSEPTALERVGWMAAMGVSSSLMGATAGTFAGALLSMPSEKTERFSLPPTLPEFGLEDDATSRPSLGVSRSSLGLEAGANGSVPTNRTP